MTSLTPKRIAFRPVAQIRQATTPSPSRIQCGPTLSRRRWPNEESYRLNSPALEVHGAEGHRKVRFEGVKARRLYTASSISPGEWQRWRLKTPLPWVLHSEPHPSGAQVSKSTENCSHLRQAAVWLDQRRGGQSNSAGVVDRFCSPAGGRFM